MPTKTEREYYRMGFKDGLNSARKVAPEVPTYAEYQSTRISEFGERKKRKLSAWNKFVKANSKKPRFRLRSGKLNLKKMGDAFRRKRK
tara:strand:- start:1222 stop:1485 length:264 start_codon:yes stop_codon:yes gene_type:complete